MEVFPDEVLAKIVSSLSGSDLGRCRIGFGKKKREVIEVGSWSALRQSSGMNDIGKLYKDERWQELYASYLKIGGKAGTRWLLLNDEEPSVNQRAKLSGKRLLSLYKAGSIKISPRRLVDAARRLGKSGHWHISAEILFLLMQDNLSDAVTWNVQLRIDAADAIIDKLYAATYVVSSDEDSLALLKAYIWASEARNLLEKYSDETVVTSGPKEDLSKDSIVLPEMPIDVIPLVSLSLRALKVEASRVFGRVAALLGQYIGSGAFRRAVLYRIETATSFSFPQNATQLFDCGLLALKNAMSSDKNDDYSRHRFALCLATKAELFYCRASAMTLTVENINSAATFPLIFLHLQNSVRLTREALSILDSYKRFAHSLDAATMCKDLGKVYNFLYQTTSTTSLTTFGNTDVDFPTPADIDSYRRDAVHFGTRAHTLAIELCSSHAHPFIQNTERLLYASSAHNMGDMQATISTFMTPDRVRGRIVIRPRSSDINSVVDYTDDEDSDSNEDAS